MKKLYVISHFLIFAGWMAFMFLSAWGFSKGPELRVGIALFGIAACMLGAIGFLGVCMNKGFWDYQKDYTKKLEDLDKAAERYRVAEKKLVNSVLEDTGVFKK